MVDVVVVVVVVLLTTARKHPVALAEHLGVRLPASPPSRALDNQQLLPVEGSSWDSTSGWTESDEPHLCCKKAIHAGMKTTRGDLRIQCHKIIPKPSYTDP